MVNMNTEAVVAAYTKTVYGVALTHTRCSADADDVFQEVFLAYHRAHPVFNDEEHRKAWLLRTTINFALKMTQSSWAKKTIVKDIEQDSLPYSAQQEQFGFHTEEQDELYAAIRALSDDCRTAIYLFYFEDLSIAKIAAILDEQEGTIKTRLSRARSKLRQLLEPEQDKVKESERAVAS
jgi:RNA polymerase sigma-70 factor (ECF subfamily)